MKLYWYFINLMVLNMWNTHRKSLVSVLNISNSHEKPSFEYYYSNSQFSQVKPPAYIFAQLMCTARSHVLQLIEFFLVSLGGMGCMQMMQKSWSSGEFERVYRALACGFDFFAGVVFRCLFNFLSSAASRFARFSLNSSRFSGDVSSELFMGGRPRFAFGGFGVVGLKGPISSKTDMLDATKPIKILQITFKYDQTT